MRIILLLSLLGMTGCQTVQMNDRSAAKIPVHSQESLIELRQAVKKLMNDRDILIAASAFTKSDKLIIQRRPIRGPGGRVIDTRVDEQPIIFNLFIEDGSCYLLNNNTDATVRLSRANCTSL